MNLINLVFNIFHEEDDKRILKLYSKVCDELSNMEFVGNKDQPFYDLVYHGLTKKIIELFMESGQCDIRRGTLLILIDLLLEARIKADG